MPLGIGTVKGPTPTIWNDREGGVKFMPAGTGKLAGGICKLNPFTPDTTLFTEPQIFPRPVLKVARSPCTLVNCWMTGGIAAKLGRLPGISEQTFESKPPEPWLAQRLVTLKSEG